MEYVYHAVPKNLTGNRLIPLNDLKDTHPEIFKAAIAKYDDHPKRKLLPTITIPILNCLWNDVVMLSPVHPHLIYQGWRKVGKSIDQSVQFYQIPIKKLKATPTVIYHYDPDEETGMPINEKNIEILHTEKYRELKELSEETLDWYKKLHQEGKFGAHFHTLPHVMAKGEIDVSDVDIIDWKEPMRIS